MVSNGILVQLDVVEIFVMAHNLNAVVNKVHDNLAKRTPFFRSTKKQRKSDQSAYYK